MEHSSSSTYSQKLSHSIYYSSIPSLPIPKNRQKGCSLSLTFELINTCICVSFPENATLPDLDKRQTTGQAPARKYLFTANQLLLAASNSSSEFINQTTTIFGEIFQQLDSQKNNFFKSTNTYLRHFDNIKKKANWFWRTRWHF